MISKINFYIDELASMKKYPDELFYIGNTEKIKKRKVSIIGTRRPNSYTKEFTYKLANGLDIRYPSVNKNLIIDIERNGLMLSSYRENEKAKNYTFVQK